MILDQLSTLGRLHRTLIAAIFALHRARYVESAQLFQRVVGDAVSEQIVPAVGEEPERCRNVRAYGRALWPRGAFTLAALHLLAHVLVHRFQRGVANSLLGHGVPLVCSSL